ncbi:MAG: hypothetical protein LC108_06210 [Anaerolineales bacterium]|nr:hypothetical protein [Anaerolineales bacterium]
MNEITYSDLLELTGQESGAVCFESGEIIICNWTQVQGIPRIFATGLIGMGEMITAELLDHAPENIIKAMQDHEREYGANEVSKDGFTAWEVNGGVIVVTQNEWN